MKKSAILVMALSCFLWTQTGTNAVTTQEPLQMVGATSTQTETLEFENGDTYAGEVKNDLMHGKGTYSFRDGSKYVGTFKDNFFSGKGKLTLMNDIVYEGDFKEDDYNGQGKLKDYSGTYVGAFKNGFKEGTDLILKGKIQSGNFVGKVSVTYKGKSYVADFTKKERVVLTNDLILDKEVAIYRGPVKKGLLNGISV